jgi:UDPglucose--hexose-1-phosphate uridylyltransferase
MPELRHDPVVGYWTIISTERSVRPVEVRPKWVAEERRCPFCEGHEAETSREMHAVRKLGTLPDTPGWQVRAIQSKTPLLSFGGETGRLTRGIYDVMNGIGTHELIIESPRHNHSLDELSVAEIEIVARVYADRLGQLEKDPRFKYVLLFKNHGLISGSANDIIRHTRSQLIGTPVTPKRLKEELISAKNYFDRRGRCVFCDLIAQELKDTARVVAENGSFLAFCPFASRTPFETWILPKKHGSDFGKMDAGDFYWFASVLKSSLSKIRLLLDDPPYNMVLHTAPYRHGAQKGNWDTIERDYHWYFQISPRLTKDAGFEWGTGIYINPTPPEEAAGLLRGTEVSLA